MGSRRACEGIIESGRVTVDGRRVVQQGVLIDPRTQRVRVDGRRVTPERKIYLLFNKPRRVICSTGDPRGRPTVMDYLPGIPRRVYTVGRLDWDSEGLLLVTNDGHFAQRLAHPRHHVPKSYHVWVDGELTRGDESRLVRGVTSRGETLRAVSVARVRKGGRKTVYEIVLSEGRNRQVRRMFDALGRHVVRLKRMRIGPLTLGRLPAGAWRHLTEREIGTLLGATRDGR